MTITKKIFTVLMCMVLSVLTFTSVDIFESTSGQSYSISAFAASKKDKNKLSGKSKTYISSLTNPAITVCMNTDKQVNRMRSKLNNINFWTSGCNSSYIICSVSENFIPSRALKIASGLFKAADSCGKKAGKAGKKLNEMVNKNSKRKGIKVTFRTFGDWRVEYQ